MKSKHLHSLNAAFFTDRKFLKLSTTLLASCTFFSFANSAEALDVDLSKKPINIPTLDYLKNNNQSIPQINASPITSPNSNYKIEAGTVDDHTFEYKSADANGNVVTNYYKIVLNKPADNVNISTATGHISWDVVETSGENVIDVTLPNNVVKHFKYTYTKPSDYSDSTSRQGKISSSNAQNVLYHDIIGANDGGVFDNTANNSSTTIKADFLNNSVNHMADDGGGGEIYVWRRH